MPSRFGWLLALSRAKTVIWAACTLARDHASGDRERSLGPGRESGRILLRLHRDCGRVVLGDIMYLRRLRIVKP
jgi:hypothetical protein